MPIKVERGTLTRIRENPGQIVLQVRSASAPEAAAQALAAARADIAALDAGHESMPNLSPGDRNDPKYVGPVMPAGECALVMIDGGYTRYRLLRTIPELVARRLASAGVEDAVISCPRQGGPLDQLDAVGSVARLRIYPPPPRTHREVARIPADWLGELVRWLAPAGSDPDERCLAAVVATQFPLALGEAAGFLEDCRRAEVGTATIVAGELSERVRGVGGFFRGGVSSVELAEGGPAASAEEVVAALERLKQVARALAEQIGYAFADIAPHTSGLRARTIGSEWTARGGPSPDHFPLLCDRLVLDAYPYQVLNTGHLERLGGKPQGARDLSGGRVELALEDPYAWMIDPAARQRDEYGRFRRRWASQMRRDTGVQARAREALARCLVDYEEALRM